MRNRTYLDTSDAMVAYAKKHGAKYDYTQRQWYVEGEVPHELLGLIPKKPNKSVHIVAPSCPLCGCHMVQRPRRSDGYHFWGCSQHPKCKGVVALEDHLVCVEPLGPKSAADFLKSSATGRSPLSKNVAAPALPPALQHAVERVIALAEKILGAKRVEKWLSSPKVTLKGRTPLELMTSAEGCYVVEKLLLSIQE